MKRLAVIISILCVVLLFAGYGRCDPLDDLMEQFGQGLEAAKPPSAYSSVKSDYKIEQAALGTIYTTKALGLLYRQNQQLLEKYDEMLLKYDQVIDQNKKIIKLLSEIAKKKESVK